MDYGKNPRFNVTLYRNLLDHLGPDDVRRTFELFYFKIIYLLRFHYADLILSTVYLETIFGFGP